MVENIPSADERTASWYRARYVDLKTLSERKAGEIEEYRRQVQYLETLLAAGGCTCRKKDAQAPSAGR